LRCWKFSTRSRQQQSAIGLGWLGVDALVGAQTRSHRDLDLVVDVDDLQLCMAVLASRGYLVETDWLPRRVELGASGERWVDLHRVVFDGHGIGVQGDPEGTHFLYPPTAFATGRLAGRLPPCLSVHQQELFHSVVTFDPRTITIFDN